MEEEDTEIMSSRSANFRSAISVAQSKDSILYTPRAAALNEEKRAKY